MVEKTTHVAKHCKAAPCRKGRNQHTVLLLLLLFHVEMVEIYIQYSINNVISNSKSSNKGTIQFTV